MLITCPSCSSAFRIDIDRVGPEGRSVRCGACREPWFVSPQEVLAAQAEELGVTPEVFPGAGEGGATDPELAAWLTAMPDPVPADGTVVDNVPTAPRRKVKAKPAARRAAEAKPSGRKGLAGLSPTTAAGLAILAAVPLACLARVPVVRALPQTAGLYARIGLPVNLRGLELRDVVAYRNPAESSRPAELVIEGDLVGVARGDSPVPAMAAELRDAADRTVATYPIPAPRSVLGEAETARFRARFPDPPSGGRSVELRFGDAAARDVAKADPTKTEPVKTDTMKADTAEGGGYGLPLADPHAAPEPPPAKASSDHAPAHGH